MKTRVAQAAREMILEHIHESWHPRIDEMIAGAVPENDFAMFTFLGNSVIAEITRRAIANNETRKAAFESACVEMVDLQKVSIFSEATDTAVRDAVWERICREIPVFEFKSRRGGE